MAIAHETATRNALADAFAAQVDEGTTYAGGRVVFGGNFHPIGASAYATLVMSPTAFGAASNGIITANAITPDSDAVGSGFDSVEIFEIQNRDGDIVLTGTVTATGGGGDITLSSTNIGSGDTVSITSLTYEASV